MRKVRGFYVMLFCVLLLTEILIALFVRDRFIRPYFGDVLVTVLLCSFLRIFWPKGVSTLPIYVFLFAAAVEVGQFFDIAARLGIQREFFLILLGSSFSFLDLLCYAAGCLVAFWIDRTISACREKPCKSGCGSN